MIIRWLIPIFSFKDLHTAPISTSDSPKRSPHAVSFQTARASRCHDNNAGLILRFYGNRTEGVETDSHYRTSNGRIMLSQIPGTVSLLTEHLGFCSLYLNIVCSTVWKLGNKTQDSDRRDKHVWLFPFSGFSEERDALSSLLLNFTLEYTEFSRF